MADKKQRKAERLKVLNDRRSSIYSRLTTKHKLDPDTSMAILANMEWESGGQLDPSRRQGKLGGSNQKMSEDDWWKEVDSTKIGRGTGIVQWDGSRRYDLKKYAEDNKADLYSIDTQVDFLMHELGGNEKKAFKLMNEAKTLKDKATIFATKFERAGQPHIDQRLKNLKAYSDLGFGKPVTLDEQVDNLIERPMPLSFQNQVMSDVFNKKITEIPEAPNTIDEASQISRSIAGKFEDIQEPQIALDKVNKFVKQKQSEFGGASAFQPAGLTERVTRAVTNTTMEAPSYLIDKIKRIPDIEQSDIDEMGNNFVDHLTEDSAIGLGIQRGLQGLLSSDKVDPNFNPKDDNLYEHFTENLDNEDLTSLLEDYSYNQKDFRLVGNMMNQRNARIKEMEAYSKENPVLSGVNFMGSMLTDAAIFMPVTSAIAAQGAATMTNVGFKSLTAAKKLGWLTAAEVVEQGGQELVWSVYKKDYEFSPLIFMSGVGMGVGMRGAMDSFANNRAVKDMLANEKGFITMGKQQAKSLVEQVAKETDNKQAIQLARHLSEAKLARAQVIRKKILQDYDIVQVGIQQSKKALKLVKKGTPAHKAIKSELQKLTRRAATEEKNMTQQLRQLVNGNHPALKTALNPEFNIKKMSKELGIDYDLVSSPDKIRNFLGLKHGDFAEGLVVDGEKGYELILNKQLKELDTNKRLNINHFLNNVSDTMATSPLDINSGIGRYMNEFIKGQASTDSNLTKYIANKGNLVNSDNPYVRGFYNLLAADNSGRQGASKIRMGETKTIYRNRYHGTLMDNYKTQGYELLKHRAIGKSLKEKISVYADFGKFEQEVVPVFRDRLTMDSIDFKAKYSDTRVQEISDEFAKGYNKLNKDVANDAMNKGVLGIGESSEDFIHRSWASNKARLIPKDDLADAIEAGMRKKLLDEGLPFDDKFLKTQAKNFAFGLQSKDITHNIEATSTYVENLNKFLKSAEGQSSDDVIKATESAISKANAQKAANELGELGKRAEIDITVEIPNTNGKTLADLMDDNFISTQDRYNSRMAARTAAAEHGIKDIKVLDSWRNDAILAEKKRLIANNSEHIAGNVEYLDKVMKQDIKSFQYGGLGGQGDVLEAEANDTIRLLKKLSVTNLMQNVGIASIAEYGGTVAEIGVYNSIKSFIDPIQHMIRKNHILGSGVTNIRSITDDMASLTGIGMGDMAFSSRGVSQAERIYKQGVMSHVEGAIDAAGSVTQNSLSWIETAGRKATSNGLAVKWGRHFKGDDPKGFIDSLMTSQKATTKRALENVNLGGWIDEGGEQVFKTNEIYDTIKDNYLKHVSFDDNGGVKAMNFDKWQPDARDAFRDTIKIQTSHIYADPDSTTAAFWQTTSLGRILNQFRTFSVNATSKIAGFTYGNLANGIKHNDMDEVMKFSNKMFWAATMGTLAVGLRDELTSAGTGSDKGFAQMADTPFQSVAIGFSRSSLIGNMDLVNGVGGSLFGYDNIFNRSSFTGRDKNFFNLANTPIGQIGVNTFKGASGVLQGDFEAAGKAAGKLTPFKRQLGIQQAINFLNK